MGFSGTSFRTLRTEGPNKFYASLTKEKNALVCTHGCYLYDVKCRNVGAGTLYLVVFDAVTLPGNGAFTVPHLTPIKVATDSDVQVSYVMGRKMLNGITVALSSTDETMTLAAAADGLFDLTYL